ncbi:MAG: major facilitator superfamily 1 [Acidobacteriaceae bacterium]|nr:major facilitator superfamily 1 [Acidobacteriaceae bacterium]
MTKTAEDNLRSSAPNASWIVGLTTQERSTLIATFGGWLLDGMDVMVYSFVIPTLILQWHLTHGQAGLLGTVTLLISAVGGWLAGIAADRYGRTRVLQITILWFALFTFLSGFTNSYWQLLITRGLQGLGFGGEWAVGSVLMGEAIRSQHRGKAVGTVQGGWAIGWGLAAISYAALFSILPAALAWRVMFWIGILPALLVIYIRRHVPEPETSTLAREKRQQSGAKAQFLEIFHPKMLRITVLTSLMSVGLQGGYYAITTWLPTYLKTVRGLSVLNTSAYLYMVIIGSLCGYLVSADLADRLGRKWTLLLFAVNSFLAVWAYTCLPISNHVMLALGFPLGFFASGSFSPIGAYFTELFPGRFRASGQGFSYNLGRGVGALFPALVGFISARMELGKAIAIFATGAYLVVILVIGLLPETKGKALLS